MFPPPMSLVNRLAEKLQRHPKRIVFPEGSDARILQAARQWVTRRLGAPILLGDRAHIKESAARLDINLQGIRLLEPERSEEFAPFAEQLAALFRRDGRDPADAAAALRDPATFAAMMLMAGQADAFVGGGATSVQRALGPLLQVIPRQENVQTVSSLMILDFDEKKVGSDGALFLADCGVIPAPTAEQLADIAITTATLARHLTNEPPRVALLSHSTHSDSADPGAVKVRAATALARARAAAAGLPCEIDGDLQVDAALDPRAARLKRVEGAVAGRANVLIFPDLASGHTAYKLAQILAEANCFGHILTGLGKPVAEIGRSASAHDIFGAAAIVGCQAIDRRLLYGTA